MISNESEAVGLFAFKLNAAEFQLDDAFLQSYQARKVNWGPVGYVTYKRTYSRKQTLNHGGAHRTVEPGMSEEWWQTCARVVEGCYQIQQRHQLYHGQYWNADKAQASAQDMYERLFTFKWTPPGRGLWMMGTPFIRRHGSAALNNCGFVSTATIDEDFAAPFGFLMDMLMLGVGIGGDTRGKGKVIIVEPMRFGKRAIEDSREGWVHAFATTLLAYVGKETLPTWDYSKIRAAGSPIRGFGGTAEGPEPLRRLLEEDVPKILAPLVGKAITSAAIVDLYNVVGKCVVAGNVRRSAEILFGDHDDTEFMDLKNPQIYPEEMKSHRWASNNSIFAEVGMDYAPVAARIVEAGEPGLIWLSNIRHYSRMLNPPDYLDFKVMGANPCVEQSLENWELCCLVETFPANCADYTDYVATLKKAYLYAKTVTLLPTHDSRTNAVMLRNRRIGTSQSGIIQNFAKVGRDTHMLWCRDGYEYLQLLDEEYSSWLAVRESIKTTSVKPSGTVSKLCGATAGIHYPPAEYYIQRIRFATGTALLQELIDKGYPTEPCVYGGPGTTVVEIPVKERNFLAGEQDVSPAEQLRNAVDLQENWADNQVSCTVKFDNSDKAQAAKEIAELLSANDQKLKGISFLPHAHGYDQAPWEPIDQAEYERRKSELNLDGELSVSKDVIDSVERFCDGDLCTLPIGD